MFSRAELKNGAKDQLRGKWLLAVLVFICYSVILQLINIDLTNSMEGSMLGISLNIVGLLVFGSIEVGMCRFTLKLAHKDETTQFNDLFSGFDVFIKALVMNLIISVCVVIGSMLFIIPGIIFGIISLLCASIKFYRMVNISFNTIWNRLIMVCSLLSNDNG